MEKIQQKWSGWYSFALLAIIVAMIAVSILMPLQYIRFTWLLNMAMLALFVLVTGFGVTGRLSGVLIDFRFRWNLSRLQMVLWTIIILSAFFTIAIWNIFSKQTEPLAIKLQEELWLLMGISTTSLIGSPRIISNNRGKKVNENETKKILSNLTFMRSMDTEINLEPDKISKENLTYKNFGPYVANKNIKDAGAIDLFKGEETENAAQLDLGRIQMLYFTVITLIAYAVSLYQMFSNVAETGGKITQFPVLSGSMIGLLAISHGGYLVNKAILQSKPEPIKK